MAWQLLTYHTFFRSTSNKSSTSIGLDGDLRNGSANPLTLHVVNIYGSFFSAIAAPSQAGQSLLGQNFAVL